MKVPVLRASRNIEGRVTFPRSWREREAIERADLLKDWIGDLKGEYVKALHDLGVEFGRRRASPNWGGARKGSGRKRQKGKR